MEDKIMIGTGRPEWNEFIGNIQKMAAYVCCSCGSVLQCQQTVRDHWQQGHMDYPIYATREEMIKAKLEQIQARRAREL